MAPELNSDTVAALDYDVVVHEVMDRLMQLAALSTKVEQTGRQASDALALLGGVAPLLRKIVDDATAAGAQVAAWRTDATAEMRHAFEEETARMERLVADVDASSRADRDTAAAVLYAHLERLEHNSRESAQVTRELAIAVDTRSAQVAAVVEAQSRTVLDATTRSANDIAARVGELGATLSRRMDAVSRGLTIASYVVGVLIVGGFAALALAWLGDLARLVSILKLRF